jgi:hypothetical protein
MCTRRSFLAASLAGMTATGASLPLLRWGLSPSEGMLDRDGPLAPEVRALLERHLRLWEDSSPLNLQGLRAQNPEWDFMSRTFLALAFACAGLREPNPRYLRAIDRIIEDTLATEASRGMHHFLLPYSKRAPFADPGGRSLFIDGEIAVMMGCRRLLQDTPRWQAPFAERIRFIDESLSRGPIGSGESYPDECWSFCNSFGLLALRMSEALDGDSHRERIDTWLHMAREHLIDPTTGLLVSSYSWDGRHLDGPEGSSLFLTAHNLRLLDPALGVEQYARGKQALGRSFLGFGFSREWPTSWVGPTDIDSGPIVPILQGSPSASGFMILAARSFCDEPTFRSLVSALHLVGVPKTTDGARRFLSSNAIGDAVITYGLVAGPVFAEIAQRC